MTTIAEGLSALGTALGIVKTLREIDRGVQEAEYKLQIANMTSALADAKLALVDAQDTARSQKDEIEKLKAASRFREEETVRANGFLYRKTDGRPAGKPYCSVCSDDGHFIHLVTVPTKEGTVYKCPRCNGNYGWSVQEYTE